MAKLVYSLLFAGLWSFSIHTQSATGFLEEALGDLTPSGSSDRSAGPNSPVVLRRSSDSKTGDSSRTLVVKYKTVAPFVLTRR